MGYLLRGCITLLCIVEIMNSKESNSGFNSPNPPVIFYWQLHYSHHDLSDSQCSSSMLSRCIHMSNTLISGSLSRSTCHDSLAFCFFTIPLSAIHWTDWCALYLSIYLDKMQRSSFRPDTLWTLCFDAILVVPRAMDQFSREDILKPGLMGHIDVGLIG